MKWNDKLREARKAQGITQAQLADTLCLHRSTIANWEIGRRRPTFLELKRIAEILHVDMNYLTEGKEVDTRQDLITRAGDVFNDLNIPDSDKDLIFQDVMKIYMEGKQNNGAKRNSR